MRFLFSLQNHFCDFETHDCEFYCIMLYAIFLFSHSIEECEFCLHTFRISIPISFAWGALWQSASRTSTKIPETLDRVTRANLSRHIPRPLLGSPLARLPFVRFNSSVRPFDFASLGRKCPGDFSCRVYPPSSVCLTYFSSHGDTALRFASP